MLTIPGTADQVKAGNIHSLAVTGTARSSELPDVPTGQELGFKDFVAELWNTLVAPKGTPRPIIDRLNVALNAAMQEATVQTKFRNNGLVPETFSPAATKAFVDTEAAKWTDVVKTSNVKDE